LIFKEHFLSGVIKALSQKNVDLGKARDRYLALKASKDHLEASLVKDQCGSSQAERVTMAKASEAWIRFHERLARAESEYEFYKLQYKILELEFQAQYLTAKLDQELIKKGVP